MAKAKAVSQMSKEELEKKADIARRARVDADNKKRASDAAKAEEKLAKTPLSSEEKAFIARIRPKMNMGRPIDQPDAADITRYSKLIKREKI